MASSSDILREYLVALGWKIDEKGAKKFDRVIQGTEKAANALTKQLFAVGAATTAMVASFAYNMEKLYYASKRTKASVGNIQALSGEDGRNVGDAQGLRAHAGATATGANVGGSANQTGPDSHGQALWADHDPCEDLFPCWP